MQFKPWRPKVPEVLRKRAPVPPQDQRAKMAALLRSWHLSVPSADDVSRLAEALGMASDGTISASQRRELLRLHTFALGYREQLLGTIAALSR